MYQLSLNSTLWFRRRQGDRQMDRSRMERPKEKLACAVDGMPLQILLLVTNVASSITDRRKEGHALAHP